MQSIPVLINGAYEYHDYRIPSELGGAFESAATNLVDVNNEHTPPFDGQRVTIYLNEYQADRYLVTAYNWPHADSMNINSGLMAGRTYTLTNVQDFTDTTEGVVPSSGIITLDMRAESHSVTSPYEGTAAKKSFPEFGCFILEVQ